ncbi:MAG: RsbRD N-terminal domain-containing protein [Desulfobacteraceae bacterium]|jgi:hypothetical protein
MDLLKHLARKKNAIVKQWFDRLMATYPADTAQFLRSQKDAFANPVGRNSLKSLEHILDHILTDFNPKTAKPIIDPIIRIRAIQDFTPSKAVRFVFDLKDIVRNIAAADPDDRQSQRILADLDHRIDDLGLLAFDIYMQCREKIYDLKANEMRARTLSAFNRAGLIKERDEDPS